MAATLLSERDRDRARPEVRQRDYSRWGWWAWDYARLWFCYCLASVIGWLINLALNALGGSLVSFILWATYTSSLNFTSKTFTPAEIAAALTVGLGGVGAARRLMTDTERLDSLHRSFNRLSGNVIDLTTQMSALQEMMAKPPTPAPNGANQATPVPPSGTIDNKPAIEHTE